MLLNLDGPHPKGLTLRVYARTDGEKLPATSHARIDAQKFALLS